MIFSSNISFAETKVDPLIWIMAENPSAALNTMKAFGTKSINGTASADILIRTISEDVADDVAELVKVLGGEPRSIIHDILTATIPLSAVIDLEAESNVLYIESAKPVRTEMSLARATTNVDDVQTGNGTTGSTAYNGSGVIFGIVDSGIDCDHADFNDSSGTTRMLAYWDQTASGTGVSEISNSGGNEHTGTELTDGTCTNSPDSDSSGHGTHVAGIATSSNSTYKGVAPSASIIAVKLSEPSVGTLSTSYSSYVTSLSTNVIDAVNYIFKKAQSLGKPAVVNLSIGTSLGAHDGTSLFESGLDALLIESGTTEKQGRAIVNAAGNENARYLNSSTAGGIHATINVSPSQDKAFEILTPFTTGYNPVSAVGGTWIDIWLAKGSSCTIAINAYSKNANTLQKAMTAVSAGSSNKSSPATDGTVSMYIDFSDSSNSLNTKQHAIGLITASSSSALANYSFDLVFSGTCTGNAWLYFDAVNYNLFTKSRASTIKTTVSYSYVDGDSNSTMTIPATANRVISVGSFMDRATWTDINGNSRSQESVTNGTASDISYFSSLGPAIATEGGSNRTKPDIIAPGEPIISTLASNVSVSSANKGDSTHHKLEGTSMASPHVAGTVALLLEKNACLKAADIKSSLQGTASSDAYTGSSLPTNTWGYGKLNALAAVNNVTAATCTPNNSSEGTSGTSGGSSGGSSGSSSSTSSSSGCSSLISSDLPIFRSPDLLPVFVAFLPIFALLSLRYGTSPHKKSRSK